MASEKLVSYIERHLKKGIHSDKIKSVLLEAGHNSEKVEEAFSHVHFKNNLTKIMVVVAVLVLLIALILIEATKPQKKVAEEAVTSEMKETTTTVKISEKTEEEKKKLLEIIYDNPEYIKYKALIYAAFIEDDISYCERIINEDVKKDCKKFVLEGIW